MGFDKIIKLVGVIVAVVAGLVSIPYAAEAIVVLGLIGGWFIVDDDRPRFYMATVALYTVAGAAGALPAVGEYITAILTSLSHLFGAACITAIVMATVDRVKP